MGSHESLGAFQLLFHGLFSTLATLASLPLLLGAGNQTQHVLSHLISQQISLSVVMTSDLNQDDLITSFQLTYFFENFTSEHGSILKLEDGTDNTYTVHTSIQICRYTYIIHICVYTFRETLSFFFLSTSSVGVSLCDTILTYATRLRVGDWLSLRVIV